MSENKSVYDDFIEFRAIIVQCVALSWSDPTFKEEFNEHPIKTMKEYFGYEYPFDINFRFDREGSDKDYRWYPRGTGAWVGPNNKIKLVLPPKPPKNQMAIALSAYHVGHLFLWDED
ncbi:MAG: hypothetical protein HKP58_16105 [Desulfatitalea sp.]|nr:BMA_0021/BMA_0022 family TOMM bacteriocin [Desulfatitalea sp.]NNK01936.1 hypothetical protein [Desulfatitalea sp.]